MTITIGVPDRDSLVDRQFVEIPGPDGIVKSFQYDAETNTLISKDNQIIIPSFHGLTHVSEDQIPEATPWLRGLISAEDKAKLDSLTQTRLGVLGFIGSGFPEDGGLMSGDIILAAGSEFISLERVGNIIRITAESPIPLSCSCEACAQIYWISDESDTRSVRPPSCNGVMPGVNAYGEMKVYMYPSNVIFNPNDTSSFFAQKSSVPTLIFKRYENGNVNNTAEYHLVLKRRSDTTTNVGWSFTPGPSQVAECVWYMGDDKDGRQLLFKLRTESEPGLLGALLYNGHTITRQMGIITGYTSNILLTNQYYFKKWSIQDTEPVGSQLVATNIWNYTEFDTETSKLTYDSTIQLLGIGDLIELWEFEISNINGVAKYAYYFRQKPSINQDHLWSLTGVVKFGDLFEQRDDINQKISPIGTGTELTAHIDDVSDIRIYEKTIWGITGFPDNVYSTNDGRKNSDGNYEPSGTIINSRYQAYIDHSLPGLVVKEIPQDKRGDINDDGVVDDTDLQLLMDSMETSIGDSAYNSAADLNSDGVIDVRDLGIFGTSYNIEAQKFSDLPLFIWHRLAHKNFLLKAKIGRPDSSEFPPIDLLLNAPIDSMDDEFINIVNRGIYETGVYMNQPYLTIEGINFEKMPPNGAIRILTGVYRDIMWKYHTKIIDGNRVVLVGNEDIFPFDEDYLNPTVMPLTPTNQVIAQVVHSDYTAQAARFEFSVNSTTDQESVQLQVRAGTLSMKTPYEYDRTSINSDPYHYDDFVRGFLPGEFTISDVFTQIGFISDGIGSNVESTPEDFKVYNGGFLPAPIGDETEKWNDLTVMVRDGQLWIWWNGMAVSPDKSKSAQLPTPVTVNTPYFPIISSVGKVGFRLWPGAKIRDIEVSDQLKHFNEFTS
jgi:hypothetical protein